MLCDLSVLSTAFRRRRAWALIVPAALALLTLAATGCGQSVPAGAVANVDGEVIEKRDFDRWLNAAARSQQAQPGAAPGQVAVPDPPEFRKCAAARVRQPAGRGAAKLSEQQARDLCRQEYGLLRDQVMQFLISAQWIEAEAEERGIEASEREVDRMFEDQKRQSFPSDAEYRQFLQASGQSEADLKFRVRLDVLSNKVREEIVKGKANASNAEVRNFYNRNRGQFGQPERRDLSVVLTEKEADAKRARDAIEGGQSFARVAKRYSTDEASKDEGGKLTGVAKGQQEAALDRAVFAAKKGELVGPVRTQFGWYVFRVDKVTPGSQQPFEQARETIRAQLRSQKEQDALTAFVREFQKEYKEKTNCARGYTVAHCKNGPKLQDPASPQGQGSPQGGAPPTQGGQSAPPQGGGQAPGGGGGG
ncbi:MAG: peptidyl-prolyl cis-trans isomerase [Actinomycetota bacterium]|nr:peptidyl-prolyl cis-trans isomerase [Actinomycetota bacterium]